PVERACGLTVTMLTSGSVGWVATEAMADSGSLQPASSGAMAVSASKMPADRTRGPDIGMISPNCIESGHGMKPRSRWQQRRPDLLHRNTAQCHTGLAP